MNYSGRKTPKAVKTSDTKRKLTPPKSKKTKGY